MHSTCRVSPGVPTLRNQPNKQNTPVGVESLVRVFLLLWIVIPEVQNTNSRCGHTERVRALDYARDTPNRTLDPCVSQKWFNAPTAPTQLDEPAQRRGLFHPEGAYFRY